MSHLEARPTPVRGRLATRAFAVCAPVVAAAGLALTGGGAAQAADAHAAKSCSPPKYPGTGYFTTMSVSGLGCSSGKKVVLAHYRCRVKGGVKGKCSSRVSGYRCTEKRRSISTEIDGVVTCKKGSKKVTYSYQQDT